mmetsp:Transcript_24947/g.41107  ORF Transcript_24947/g.41107 Transcript_24947/m.41107 type:complete len:577 (+) Transcript_24947:225-1955(+)
MGSCASTTKVTPGAPLQPGVNYVVKQDPNTTVYVINDPLTDDKKPLGADYVKPIAYPEADGPGAKTTSTVFTNTTEGYDDDKIPVTTTTTTTITRKTMVRKYKIINGQKVEIPVTDEVTPPVKPDVHKYKINAEGERVEVPLDSTDVVSVAQAAVVEEPKSLAPPVIIPVSVSSVPITAPDTTASKRVIHKYMIVNGEKVEVPLEEGESVAALDTAAPGTAVVVQKTITSGVAPDEATTSALPEVEPITVTRDVVFPDTVTVPDTVVVPEPVIVKAEPSIVEEVTAAAPSLVETVKAESASVVVEDVAPTVTSAVEDVTTSAKSAVEEVTSSAKESATEAVTSVVEAVPETVTVPTSSPPTVEIPSAVLAPAAAALVEPLSPTTPTVARKMNAREKALNVFPKYESDKPKLVRHLMPSLALALKVDRLFLDVRDPITGTHRIFAAWKKNAEVPDVDAPVFHHDKWQYDAPEVEAEDPLLVRALKGEQAVFVESVDVAAEAGEINVELEKEKYKHTAFFRGGVFSNEKLYGVLEGSNFEGPRVWSDNDKDLVNEMTVRLAPIALEFSSSASHSTIED